MSNDRLRTVHTLPGIREILHPHGQVVCSYDPEFGWFYIAELDVDEMARRQGIGKQLLREAKRQAELEMPELILASIVSRESLQAFKAVFGEQHIKVEQEGDFGPVSNTLAILEYHPERSS